MEDNSEDNMIIASSSSIMDDEDQTMIEEFSAVEDDSGAIIFSPQDLMKNMKSVMSDKGFINPKMRSKVSMSETMGMPGGQLTCDICNKIMSSEKTLVQHMSTHLGVKPFQCPHCDKSFSRKVHLQGHLASHGICKQYECPLCHQRFSRPDCVKIHMRLHDKSKCVTCDICHKNFLTIGSLNMHLRIHRGEKPFKCHICSKCFTQKTHLISHTKRHLNVKDDNFTKKLGPRIFKCSHCPRSFIRLSDYERHVQWNHGAVADDVYSKSGGNSSTMQSFITPKEQKSMRRKANIFNQEVVTCNSSTQTDEGGGHIIIPRKYQSTDSQSQASPPSTPMHEAEYDIFDEGMDRNYSSDEDEDNRIKPSTDMPVQISSVNTAIDDAFDVVAGEISPSSVPKAFKAPYMHQDSLFNKEKPSSIMPDQPIPVSGIRNSYPNTSITLPGTLSKKVFTVTAPVVRPRGRPRGSKKEKGLTGATELRLIRKSMMTFISEEAEASNSTNKEDDNNKDTVEPSIKISSLDNEVKRKRSKAKQHGKDYVCTMKGCNLCNPTTTTEPKEVVINVNKPQEEDIPTIKVEENKSKTLDKAPNFKTAQRILNIYDNLAQEHKFKTDYSSVNVNKPYYSTIKNADFLASSTDTPTMVSPHLDVQSFCIPTYSCKLCSREFRFEGKLHRHIEKVHQNKDIFALDVKPGRGTTKGNRMHTFEISSMESEEVDEPPPSNENPEIAALRSEWSDDDEDDDDEDDNDDNNQRNRMLNPMIHKLEPKIEPVVLQSDRSTLEGVNVIMNKITGRVPNHPQSVPTHKVPERIQTMKKSIVERPTVSEESSLDVKCQKLLQKLFDSQLLKKSGLGDDHVSVVLGRILKHYGVKMIEDYGQGQYEVLKYNLWRLIEWKVTMEQMEEFYTVGKSVEDMMDDIMENRVPLVSHIYQTTKTETSVTTSSNNTNTSIYQTSQISTDSSNNQMVLSQEVANAINSQFNIDGGVTQVVLAQDISPEMLQGAHIVTIDPATGQVLSEVTADQVILTNSVGGINNQQIVELGTSVISSDISNVTCINTSGVTNTTLSQAGSSQVITSDRHKGNI